MDELESWRNWARLRVSANTLASYASVLGRWLRAGGSLNDGPRDAERYLAGLSEHGLGPSGLGVVICGLRSYFRFHGRGDQVKELVCPPVPHMLHRTLSQWELMAVLQAPDTSTVQGRRDVAIVGLAVASGLRASEICRLRIADVELDRGLGKVICKGGQMQFFVFDSYCATVLAAWLAVRPAAPGVETVFVALRAKGAGRPLTREGLKYVCKSLAKRAGVAPFSPHALRRTFCTLAIEFGCPSKVVQEAGRWSNLELVDLYSKAVRMKAFDPYSPLVRLMLQ